MKKQVFSFDKSYIETFARGINSSYTQNAYQIMLSVLDEAMQNICAVRPVVTDYECQIINECLNNAETQNSSLDILLSFPYISYTSTSSFKLSILYLSNYYKTINNY